MIVDAHGLTRKILAVLGDVVLLSRDDSYDGAGNWWTIAQLKDRGDQLNPEPSAATDETTELTIEQIAEKFGLKPKQVKIKKEE